MDTRSGFEPKPLRAKLITEIYRCQTFVVLIDPGTCTRLNNPNDWVRFEIGRAILRGKTIVPVLVEGAGFPAKEDLPDDIKGLADKTAIRLTTSEALSETLRRNLGPIPDSYSDGLTHFADVSGDRVFCDLLGAKDMARLSRDEKPAVIVGSAGTGKTITLRQLILAMKTQSRWIPVYVSLTQYRTQQPLEEYITGWLPGPGSQPFCDDICSTLLDLMAEGRVALFLDAVDDGPWQEFDQRLSRLRTFVERHPKCRFVFASRVWDVGRFPLREFYLKELTDSQIEEILGSRSPQLALGSLAPRIEILCRNPGYLDRLIRFRSLHKKLPQNASDLFEGDLETVEQPVRLLLQRIALHLAEGSYAGAPVPIQALRSAKILQTETDERLLNEALDDRLLVSGLGFVSFASRYVQEYLAARELENRLRSDCPGLLENCLVSYPLRETLAVAVDTSTSPKELKQDILNHVLRPPRRPDRVVAAAECLQHVTKEDATNEALPADLRDLLGGLHAVARGRLQPQLRVRALRALATLDDPLQTARTLRPLALNDPEAWVRKASLDILEDLRHRRPELAIDVPGPWRIAIASVWRVRLFRPLLVILTAGLLFAVGLWLVSRMAPDFFSLPIAILFFSAWHVIGLFVFSFARQDWANRRAWRRLGLALPKTVLGIVCAITVGLLGAVFVGPTRFPFVVAATVFSLWTAYSWIHRAG